MITNKLAVANQPLCGNRASGQLCALPMLHNGHHTRMELFQGPESVQCQEDSTGWGASRHPLIAAARPS